MSDYYTELLKQVSSRPRNIYKPFTEGVVDDCANAIESLIAERDALKKRIAELEEQRDERLSIGKRKAREILRLRVAIANTVQAIEDGGDMDSIEKRLGDALDYRRSDAEEAAMKLPSPEMRHNVAFDQIDRADGEELVAISSERPTLLYALVEALRDADLQGVVLPSLIRGPFAAWRDGLCDVLVNNHQQGRRST